jgi:hypothetical protein
MIGANSNIDDAVKKMKNYDFDSKLAQFESFCELQKTAQLSLCNLIWKKHLVINSTI